MLMVLVVWLSVVGWVECGRHNSYRQNYYHKTKSPYELGLKPSDEIPDLIFEVPNPDLEPKLKDLNYTKLAALLGTFDKNLLSIEKPMKEAPQMFPFRKTAKGRYLPKGKMPKYLKNLNFKYVKLPDGKKLDLKVSKKIKNKVQQFLWSVTTCIVHRSWRDLGLRYWPRWLNAGHCVGEPSCSIPPGLVCQTSSNSELKLLYWRCTGTQQSSLFCRWIPIHLPIVTGCSCS